MHMRNPPLDDHQKYTAGREGDVAGTEVGPLSAVVEISVRVAAHIVLAPQLGSSTRGNTDFYDSNYLKSLSPWLISWESEISMVYDVTPDGGVARCAIQI